VVKTKENMRNFEYGLFLDGYTTKQISFLLDTPHFKIQNNLKKTLKKLDKDKTLVDKSRILQMSFN